MSFYVQYSRYIFLARAVGQWCALNDVHYFATLHKKPVYKIDSKVGWLKVAKAQMGASHQHSLLAA